MLNQALAVAAAKAKLTGLVVAAAAIGGTAVAAGSTAFVPTSGEDTSTTVTSSPTPEPTEAAPLPEPSEATEQTTADPAETRTPLPCPTDVKNHGAYVSEVARDKTVTGREHGKAVSEAAHSDCGKPAEETESADSDDADKDEADDSDDEGDTRKSEKQGRGHGRR